MHRAGSCYHRRWHPACLCLVCYCLQVHGQRKVQLLQVTLWYGTIYLVFMFIYYGASSEWVYWVLNWDKPSALGLYALLPLLLFAAHLCVVSVSGGCLRGWPVLPQTRATAPWPDTAAASWGTTSHEVLRSGPPSCSIAMHLAWCLGLRRAWTAC